MPQEKSRYPTIFVFTHDSIGVGEDGPTHQAVEQLASLRAIPNLIVFRPADANETAQAWKYTLEHQDGPVALLLTRQGLPRAGPKQIQLSGKLAQRRLRSYRAEFMPYFGSIKPILEAIELLLENKDKLAQTSGELIQLAEPLVRKKACKQVTEIVVEMLH